MQLHYAYIDPSVVTFAVQAIAGAAIAVAAVVVVLWRRAKKKVSQKLGLEEKTNKEVEDDFAVTGDDTEAASASFDEDKTAR